MVRLTTRRRVKRRKDVTGRVLRANPLLPAAWGNYFKNKRLATIQYWLDLVNKPPQLGEEGTFNSQIRDYRVMSKEETEALTEQVALIVKGIAEGHPEMGFNDFDHRPLTLFLAVLGSTPLMRIRRCSVCTEPRYFLAKRDKQQTCSRRCGNLLRQWRVRGKAQDYELNRQQKLAAREYEDRPRKKRIAAAVEKTIK